MKFNVYTADGSSSSEKEYEIPEFQGDKGLQTLKDLIVAYQSNLRQGNAKAKTRSEVSGSGSKVYRQKGTGNARHGDRQAPIYVGGGVAHGPKIRDWSKDMNKKARKLAFRRAIFDKAVEGGIDLIEKFEIAEAKTKLIDAVVDKIVQKGKVLLVDQHFDNKLLLAARNIARVHVVDAASLNAYDLLRFDKVIASEQGFKQVIARANSLM